MINYWISFVFLFVNWVFAVIINGATTQFILVSMIFFGLYFITPLLKASVSKLSFVLLSVLIAIGFHSGNFNGFVWLIYLTLIIQATEYFKEQELYIYWLFVYVLEVVPYIIQENWLLIAYITMLNIITGVIYNNQLKLIKITKQSEQQIKDLENEFQSLKRQITENEEDARQEERNQIAREIHDSVGHRLTALLMQLEVERLQASSEEAQEKFTELKKLAQSSLYDTREAVKALKSEETAGIQAIIQLIRKLEAESQLRLSITMQSGVLGIVLSNQQSVVIYRSIQEALTNMMRHSSSRQAKIEFQIIAERDLRFQVGHPIKEKTKIQEGFGLTNIRERLAEINGQLTIHQTEGTLSLIGQFPLEAENNE